MCQKGKTQNILTQNLKQGLKYGVEKRVLGRRISKTGLYRNIDLVHTSVWNTEGVIFGSTCSLSWLLSKALYYGCVEIVPVIAVM